MAAVFIWSPTEERESAPGHAGRVWLFEALKSLNSSLSTKYGIDLLVRSTDSALSSLEQLIRITNATSLVFNKVYEPTMLARDDAITKALTSQGIKVRSFDGAHLLTDDPSAIRMPHDQFNGGHWGSLTPYLRASRKCIGDPSKPLEPPEQLSPCPTLTEHKPLVGCSIRDLHSIPPTYERQHKHLHHKKEKERESEEEGAVAREVESGSSGGGLVRSGAAARDAVQPQQQQRLHQSLCWGISSEKWADRMIDSWTRGWSRCVSEEAGTERLRRFLETNLRLYETHSSKADVFEERSKHRSAVSRLSPYLRFGQISPKLVFWEVKSMVKKGVLTDAQCESFIRRLYWRDLAYFQLCQFPDMHQNPIRSHYKKHPWRSSNMGDFVRRWQRGETGYPIVDAGMRELWSTGWMQQTIRMIAASFLVEYLGIDWREGHAWFHDTLVDQDTAINAMMWQNAGRSGVDQWNFVVDPVSGSQDPSGSYVRRWLPELRKLPNRYIHKPWEAPEQVLADAGVVLGETYPEMIIQDLEMAQKATVTGLQQMKRDMEDRDDWIDERGYDLITLPCGNKVRVFTRNELRAKSKKYLSNEAPSKPTDKIEKGEKKKAETPSSKPKKKRTLNERSSVGSTGRASASPKKKEEAAKRNQQKKKARELHKKFKEKTRGKINGVGRRGLSIGDIEDQFGF
eukprot:CAMPEP_0184489598 /NCGR_PEP_ID=MMETSP0113_2-20130426/15911_1 /TAXON_ID=91329 /ORGANISM="Norrisiella sphaerica, Strain BC52" /LENGTH=682 /DNA_ID=CAMNT_0026873121 /DNA_START=553 /DNA_END=2601 /DNA_ORIENTATION=+